MTTVELKFCSSPSHVSVHLDSSCRRKLALKSSSRRGLVDIQHFKEKSLTAVLKPMLPKRQSCNVRYANHDEEQQSTVELKNDDFLQEKQQQEQPYAEDATKFQFGNTESVKSRENLLCFPDLSSLGHNSRRKISYCVAGMVLISLTIVLTILISVTRVGVTFVCKYTGLTAATFRILAPYLVGIAVQFALLKEHCAATHIHSVCFGFSPCWVIGFIYCTLHINSILEPKPSKLVTSTPSSPATPVASQVSTVKRYFLIFAEFILELLLSSIMS